MDFQLYSARNFPPLADVLARLAALGYRQVEGFGGLYGELDVLRDALKKNSLFMPTAHLGLAQLKDIDATCRITDALGIRYVYCPAISKEERENPPASKWVELGETLAALGEAYRRRGVGFGWHNHDFEFVRYDGRFGMDYLLEAAPAVNVEADVAWIVRGGADAAPWLEANGERIVAVHVKDIAPKGEALNEDGWADVGHGTIDWPALAQAIKTQTNAQYWVMEHDNPSDFDRFASRSLASVKSWD